MEKLEWTKPNGFITIEYRFIGFAIMFRQSVIGILRALLTQRGKTGTKGS